MPKGLRLYKKEKLCSQTAIEKLFSSSGTEFGKLVYPLRAIAMSNPGRSSDAQIAFMISVPKKRLRHAVDRVRMRRRIREAYRLNHQNVVFEDGIRLDVAFIYVANGLTPYSEIESAMIKLLNHLQQHFMSSEPGLSENL